MENTGKWALITGGTSGIGKELAKLFAKDGYNLLLVARDQQELDTTAFELSASGIQVKTIAKDLSKMEEAKALCDEVNTPIDVLVNDAGQGVYGLFTDKNWNASWESST